MIAGIKVLKVGKKNAIRTFNRKINIIKIENGISSSDSPKI
jgi:hypothetical protein